MSYHINNKFRGLGDPITSPSQVPSDIDNMWLNLDGSNPSAPAPSSPSTTPMPATSTVADADGISPVVLLGGAAVVAYFLFKKK